MLIYYIAEAFKYDLYDVKIMLLYHTKVVLNCDYRCSNLIISLIVQSPANQSVLKPLLIVLHSASKTSERC